MKYGKKTGLPPGLTSDSFIYQGRPAKDQGDFGDDVGLADMVCCLQFGQNSDKGYHVGVVLGGGRWFVYTEWGRRTPKRSWDGVFCGQDYALEEFPSESAARAGFRKIAMSKNMARIEKDSNGIWAGKAGKDGYFVQSLATRLTGLPNAYKIKDSEGLATPVVAATPTPKRGRKAPAKVAFTGSYHPEEIRLCRDMIGGTQNYAQTAATAAGGVTPTLSSIEKVRDLLPDALGHIVRVGKSLKPKKNEDHYAFERRLALACTADTALQNLSLFIASQVPRPVADRNADAETRALRTILSSANILTLQADLDLFESTLKQTDFSLETASKSLDVNAAFNAQVRWLDPKSAQGKWVCETYASMTRNKHHHLSGRVRVLNVFEIRRPDRDSLFLQKCKALAAKDHSRAPKAGLQPSTRPDVDDPTLFARANVFLGIHGTRAVNIAPIVGSNFRLPKSLPGAQITGAAFGHGIYMATDFKKSHGYTGHSNSYWNSSGGSIKGRGFFMFLCDVAQGDPYMTPSTGSWSSPPRGHDSIFASPTHCRSLVNDEHIIFDPNQQQIRYIIEGEI